MEFLTGVYGLFVREMLKWFRQKVHIVFAFIVPVVWLILFGKSFNLSYLLKAPVGVPEPIREAVQQAIQQMLLRVFGTLDYFNFFAIGMLNAFALFTSMWSGMSLVFDRRLGYLERMLAAPVPRASIYLAKVLASVAKGLLQFTVMLILAFILGLSLKPGISPLDILAVYIVMVSLMLALSAIFTATAVKITSHDVVISISNLVNLPLIFTSNAIFPIEQMPDWLKSVATVNPLTHSISLTRYLLLGIGKASAMAVHGAYLLAFTVGCVALGSYIAGKYL